MDWKFHLDKNHNILLVKVTGKIVSERTAQMAIDGIDIARRNNCVKFLIDYTETEVDDSVIETYKFMSDLAKLGITRSDSIAIVYAGDKDKHQFAETAAANSGWNNVRYFNDLEKGIGWLRTRN